MGHFGDLAYSRKMSCTASNTWGFFQIVQKVGYLDYLIYFGLINLKDLGYFRKTSRTMNTVHTGEICLRLLIRLGIFEILKNLSYFVLLEILRIVERV